MAKERLVYPNLLIQMGTAPDLYEKDSFDNFEALEALKAAIRRVSDRVVGRRKLVEQTLLSILSREHQLIFSRTGTAKTLYAKSIFSQFDAQTFAIHLTKGTTEEAVFGAYDLQRFKEGTIWHKTKDSIITADFAFLDEFMDANDMVLRSLLEVLNERTFTKGEQFEKARLHTAIAVTNYLRQTDISEPVIDRFLYKAQLSPQMSTFDEMVVDKVYEDYGDRVVVSERPLPIEVPRELAKIIKGEDANHLITASHTVLFLKNQIIRRYANLATAERKSKDEKAEPFYISPRTRARSRDVLNASAFLHHRWQVNHEDLLALRFVLASISGNPRDEVEEERVFARAVDETLASYTNSDLALVEQIMAIAEFIEAFQKGEKIEAIRLARPRLLTRVLELLRVRSWEEVTKETFKLSLSAIETRKPALVELRNGVLTKLKENV